MGDSLFALPAHIALHCQATHCDQRQQQRNSPAAGARGHQFCKRPRRATVELTKLVRHFHYVMARLGGWLVVRGWPTTEASSGGAPHAGSLVVVGCTWNTPPAYNGSQRIAPRGTETEPPACASLSSEHDKRLRADKTNWTESCLFAGATKLRPVTSRSPSCSELAGPWLVATRPNQTGAASQLVRLDGKDPVGERDSQPGLLSGSGQADKRERKAIEKQFILLAFGVRHETATEED